MPRTTLDGWNRIEDIPQEVLESAAQYAIEAIRGDRISACSIQEANAILVCLAPYSSLASRVTSGD